MGNETKQPVTKEGALTPLKGTGVPQVVVAPTVQLNDDQFKQLQRTLVYAAAVFGTLAAGKQPSPTPANLAPLKAYADAVLEMVK